MAAAVPIVEIADDGDALRIRRPDGEVKALGAVMLERMRAHLVEQPQMRALADVIVVHRPEHRAEAVGIGDRPFAAAIAGAVAHRLDAS